MVIASKAKLNRVTDVILRPGLSASQARDIGEII